MHDHSARIASCSATITRKTKKPPPKHDDQEDAEAELPTHALSPPHPPTHTHTHAHSPPLHHLSPISFQLLSLSLFERGVAHHHASPHTLQAVPQVAVCLCVAMAMSTPNIWITNTTHHGLNSLWSEPTCALHGFSGLESSLRTINLTQNCSLTLMRGTQIATCSYRKQCR